MKTSLKLGFLTLILFGTGGILLIEYVKEISFLQVFQEGLAIHIQIIIGSMAGLFASLVAISIISRKFFNKERKYYHGLISRWNLTYSDMIFISLCAGVGEELFFRGGIQPMIGIWWTSVLFVILHGYLNPKNWRISIYGVVMVGIIGGFGYLFEYIGIFSAMLAHAVLDIVLFLYMSRVNPK